MKQNFGYKKTDNDVEYHSYQNGIEVKRIHKETGENDKKYFILFKLLFEKDVLMLQVGALNNENAFSSTKDPLVGYLGLGNFNLFDGQISYQDGKIIYFKYKKNKDKIYENVNKFIDEAEETYYKKLRKEKISYFIKSNITLKIKKYFWKPLFNFLADYPNNEECKNTFAEFNHFEYKYTNYKNLSVFKGTVFGVVVFALIIAYLLDISLRLDFNNLNNLLLIIFVILIIHYLSIGVQKVHSRLFKNKYE